MANENLKMVILALVLIVGVIAVIGLMKSSTGAAVLEDMYCRCSITKDSYYTTGAGTTLVQKVRVQSAAQHTNEHCNMLCQNTYSGSHTTVIGRAI